MLRSLLAIVAGLVTGGLIVAAVEWLGRWVYSPPPGLDMQDMEAVREFALAAPTSARLVVLLAWFVGPLGGGYTAARIARRSPVIHALIVGAIFLLADIYNMITIPSPVWFWIGGIVLPIADAYIAGRVVGRPGAIAEVV